MGRTQPESQAKVCRRHEPRKRKSLKNFCVCAVYVLLCFSCAASAPPATAQAAASSPLIGPAVEQNGVRFETWLVSSKIVIPDKSVSYEKQKAATLFSVRVTNLTQKPIRFSPFGVKLILTGPDGEEVGCGYGIAGGLHPPGEEDYLVLKPGISVVVSRPSSLCWYGNSLGLDWPSSYVDHPWNYGGIVAGSYRFEINCSMTTQDVQLLDEHTGKVVKTLNGFWTGNVTTPPLTFQLVTR